jgi:hypothetical protein
MLSTFRYFISAGFLLASLYCLGQEKDSVVKVVKPKKDFTPTGIRVGTDLIALGKTFASNSFQGWEVNGDIDLANYYLAVDIGSWSKNIEINNGQYHNGGSYYRIGVDINLLGKDPDKNMLFFGVRYGRSLFHESLDYQTDPVLTLKSASYHVSNGNVSGGWGELTSGLRVKVWKGLWMGYTARMKFAANTKGYSSAMIPYDMPGYGSLSKQPWWGFNYQLFWKFAWKKDKPVKK